MYISFYMYLHILIYVYFHIFIHEYTSTRTYTHITICLYRTQSSTHPRWWHARSHSYGYTYKYIYIYIHIFIYIKIHINLYGYICWDIHLHIQVHIYVYIYIYIHLHMCITQEPEQHAPAAIAQPRTPNILQPKSPSGAARQSVNFLKKSAVSSLIIVNKAACCLCEFLSGCASIYIHVHT